MISIRRSRRVAQGPVITKECIGLVSRGASCTPPHARYLMHATSELGSVGGAQTDGVHASIGFLLINSHDRDSFSGWQQNIPSQ